MERVWIRAMLLRSALSILSDRVPAELDGDQMRLQVKPRLSVGFATRPSG